MRIAPFSLRAVALTTIALTMQHAAADTATAQASAAVANQNISLSLRGRTELPEYTGDFDHFAADVDGNRLFLAAEDHQTLEVFDLKSGKHLKTVPGFDTPHNILYLPDMHRLIVIDSGKGMSKVVDSDSYKILDTIKLQPGADSMTYDPEEKVMYVVTGGKNGNLPTSYLDKIDPRSGKVLGELAFDTDKVEAVAVEKTGPNLFANITGKNYIAVIDRKTFSVVGTWPIKDAEMNAPMTLDEKNQRLFTVTRKPFKLLVLDSRTGRQIADFDAPNRTNELMFDKATKRIYLAGDKIMKVIQQKSADLYEELEQVPTAIGAKTALLVPERKRMFVAISTGEEKTGAAILRFDVNAPSQPKKQ